MPFFCRDVRDAVAVVRRIFDEEEKKEKGEEETSPSGIPLFCSCDSISNRGCYDTKASRKRGVLVRVPLRRHLLLQTLLLGDPR